MSDGSNDGTAGPDTTNNPDLAKVLEETQAKYSKLEKEYEALKSAAKDNKTLSEQVVNLQTEIDTMKKEAIEATRTKILEEIEALNPKISKNNKESSIEVLTAVRDALSNTAPPELGNKPAPKTEPVMRYDFKSEKWVEA